MIKLMNYCAVFFFQAAVAPASCGSGRLVFFFDCTNQLRHASGWGLSTEWQIF